MAAGEMKRGAGNKYVGGGRRMKAPARSFADLEVWKNAHSFVLEMYRLTAGFPNHECFGLTSLLRRAAVSIPANITEGFRKFTAADTAKFMNTAEGSPEECRYYCILTRDPGDGTTEHLPASLDEIARQLAGR
jgi:four helix bundle protein